MFYRGILWRGQGQALLFPCLDNEVCYIFLIFAGNTNTEANAAPCGILRVCRFGYTRWQYPRQVKQHSHGSHGWWNGRASAETTMPGGRLWIPNRQGGTQQMPSKWWWMPSGRWWMISERCWIISRYSEWWQVTVDTYVLDESPERLQQWVMQIDLFMIICEITLGDF